MDLFVTFLSALSSAEGSLEHSDLLRALAQIRYIIAAVDLTVSKYERSQELQEVLARLETKSFAKLKNGKVFRKQELHSKHRDLQHKGLVYWKTATGRLKGGYLPQDFIFSARSTFHVCLYFVCRHFGSFAHRCAGFPARERPAVHICICGKHPSKLCCETQSKLSIL